MQPGFRVCASYQITARENAERVRRSGDSCSIKRETSGWQPQSVKRDDPSGTFKRRIVARATPPFNARHHPSATDL